MSLDYYYKTLNYSPVAPKTRDISNAALSNIVVWTPATSARIAVTSLIVACNAVAGSIEFRFGGANNQQKLATFIMSGSSTIAPAISGWESTAMDAPLFVNVSTGATNAWNITAEGYEVGAPWE